MKTKFLPLLLSLFFFQTSLFAQWDFLGNHILPDGHRVWSMEVAPDGSLWVISTLDNFNLPENVSPVAFRSVDEGETWTQTVLTQGAEQIGACIAPVDAETAFVSLRAGGMAKTTDGGLTYNPVTSYTPNINFYCHFFNAEEGIAMGVMNVGDLNSIISVTQDGGETWLDFGGADWTAPAGYSLYEAIAGDYISSLFTLSSLFDVRGNTIVAGTSGGDYVISTDKGHNWVRVETPLRELGYWASSVTVTENNEVMVGGNYTGSGNGTEPTKIFTTRDNGDTWIAGSPGIENAAVHYLPETDSVFIISGHNNFGGGLFGTAITYNYGADWEKIGSERILALTFRDAQTGYGTCCDNGWITANGQIYKWNYDLPTSLPAIISDARLQIYPNPATNFLQIRVDAADFSEGTLEIISARGEIVLQRRQNFNSDLQQDISQLPKGIYLLRLQTEGKSLTKKFIKE